MNWSLNFYEIKKKVSFFVQQVSMILNYAFIFYFVFTFSQVPVYCKTDIYYILAFFNSKFDIFFLLVTVIAFTKSGLQGSKIRSFILVSSRKKLSKAIAFKGLQKYLWSSWLTFVSNEKKENFRDTNVASL